jgi:hypothetical protein
MLSSPRRRPRGPLQQSLRQEYEEFLLQQIEDYKDRLSRQELMTIADEAVRELEIGPEEQLVLTEVLVLEHVDRLIMRRLKLPTFRRWKERHLALREAQRQPGHWGLDRSTSLGELALRLGDRDTALLVGEGTVSAGLFLAAHEWPVVLIDNSIAIIESAEMRAASEGLSARFQALVVSLGSWFPNVTPTLVVLDPSTVVGLHPHARDRLIDTLKELTQPGGVHCVLHCHEPERSPSLSHEIIKNHYSGWSVISSRQSRTRRELLAAKP